MDDRALSDDELVALLQRYLTILQGHPSADEMMAEILTDDFETGFVGGHVWRGLEGLRDFVSQREGFFDERHEVEALLEREDAEGVVEAHTRLRFFLRRWESPSPVSEEFTGRCFHTWRAYGRRRMACRRPDGRALRRPERELRRLFATPDSGLNR